MSKVFALGFIVLIFILSIIGVVDLVKPVSTDILNNDIFSKKLLIVEQKIQKDLNSTNIDKKIIDIKKVKKIKKPAKTDIKKQHFLDIIVPISQSIYKELYSQYQNIKKNIEQNSSKQYINNLKKEYNVKTDHELLSAVKPHPISITLAQCAMESAWLTSRFAKEANNLFGIWSFNDKEPRIAASGSRDGKIIYLKKYKNYHDSIRDYYKNINRSWAFKEFREKKLQTNNPFKLLPYLHRYSEQKDEYPKTLKKVIIKNNFTAYDIKEKN